MTEEERARLDEVSADFRERHRQRLRSLLRAGLERDEGVDDAEIDELFAMVSVGRREEIRAVAQWCLGDTAAPTEPSVTRLAVYLLSIADEYEDAVASVIGRERARRLRWRGGDEPWNWGGMFFFGVSDGRECEERSDGT